MDVNQTEKELMTLDKSGLGGKVPCLACGGGSSTMGLAFGQGRGRGYNLATIGDDEGATRQAHVVCDVCDGTGLAPLEEAP